MVQNLNVTHNLAAEEVSFDPAQMIAATRRLSQILTEEIALLKDMRIAQIHKYYNDKIELSEFLEGYKAMLISNPDLLQSIPKRTLEEMRIEAMKFEQLIEEDRKQITRAQEVHKIVMNAVKKVLEQNTIMSSGYNKKGLINVGNNNNYITPPISINQNI